MDSCEVFVAFNRLVVRVSMPRSEEHGRVDVTGSVGNVILLTHDEADKTPGGRSAKRFRTFSKQNLIATYVSLAPFERGQLPLLLSKSVEVRMLRGDEALLERVRPIAMSFQAFAALDRQILEFFASLDDVGPAVRALRKFGIQEMPGAKAFIDYTYRGGEAVFVNGWMPNFGALKTFFFTAGCAFVARGEQGVVQPRPDVTEHLRTAGVPVLRGDSHGFAIMLDTVPGDANVQLLTLADGALWSSYNEAPVTHADPARVYQLMMGARLASAHMPLGQVTSQIKPFLRGGAVDLDYDVIRRAEFGASPAVSVVVPFYKEWRFLFSILTMVRKGPTNWHWVIVCDDPSIFPRINTMIANQEPVVRRRITLVLPRRNVGYGNANNIGATEAQSDKLLLMNSDIWISDFVPIVASLKSLDSGRYALLGYTLLFEDGTLQHDGLDFVRSSEVNDLYLAIHPRKGLPPLASPRGGIREVAAVTGALMLMTKARFTKIGGFSERYIGGDFEDADLCLALGAENEHIGLVETDTIYHLERQSIRLDATNNVAAMRTLVNCETFNQRWSKVLDARPARPMGAVT